MTTEEPTAVVVLLIGPQASGKSAIAAALSEELRGQGERVALVELDQIAGMALPTLPSWDTAAHIFALVVSEWLKTDLTCVIAEGISSRSEVSSFVDHLPADASVIKIAMTTPLETALVWARADLTRGMSRDREWLSDRYDEWSVEVPGVGADLLLDASKISVDQVVSLITSAIRWVRTGGSDERVRTP